MSRVIDLKGRVDVQRLEGKINLVASENAGGPLQAKTVYPSHSEQTIAPDEDYYGLAVVKVLAVPRKPACVVSVEETAQSIVENVVNVAVWTEVTAETLYTHALYNGVRLPIIPEDVLANYPYVFIRNNTTSGYYEMYCAVSTFFYSTSNNNIQFADSTARQRYRIEITSAETATAWEENGTSTANVGIDADKPVLWSNHDIPNGSADATDIYFAGSEPMPTD